MDNKIQKSILRIEQEVEDAPIACCDLGSCQYNGIDIAYKGFLRLFKSLGKQRTAKLLGVPKFPSRTEFIAKLQSDWEYYINQLRECDPEFAAKLDIHPPCKTIDDYYQRGRESAWDLWGTVMDPVPIAPALDLRIGGDMHLGAALALTTFLWGTPSSAFADFST